MNTLDTSWHMPAEWALHVTTWMAFPHNRVLWESEWGVGLADVQQDFATVTNAIACFEPVKLVVDPATLGRAGELCVSNVGLIELAIDGSWCCDSGPSFVYHPQLGLADASWRFSTWGGKSAYAQNASLTRRILDGLGPECLGVPPVNGGGAIHIDGEGTLITTRSVLLNASYSPDLSKAKIETLLTCLLGVTRTIQLPGDPDRVTGDMADGHVGDVCAFARPGASLPDATSDTTSACAEIVRENHRTLELALDTHGRCFELIELFDAGEVTPEGEVFCASYTNFYIASGTIIIPTYGVAVDDAAAATPARAFPAHEMVPVRIDHLAHDGGGVHCITQQQPAWPARR